MPIYEYQCGACGERREFIQKFSDAPKRKCPGCGASRLKRLVSAAAFHLKGTGWYVTDFRDKKKDGGKEATSSSKDGDKSSSKDGDKSSSKDGDKSGAKASDTSSKETTTTKTAEKTTKSSDSTTKSGDKKSAG